MRSFVFLVLIYLLPVFSANAQVIVVPKKAPESDKRAAEVLRHYLSIMTGRDVAVSNHGSAAHTLVFIGNQPAAEKAGLTPAPEMPEDAYFLHGRNNAFLVAGNGQHGAEYGVYALLELLGCRQYSPRDSLIPHVDQLHLPDYPAQISAPAFPYRELWYEPATDASWARWHKLKTRPEKEAEWGMFVHTFQKLCPPETYFEQHPEYFAWNGSQRSPGQLCLANDTVKQIVIAALREEMKKKPEAKYWSVSQNDNFDYCKCPRCTELEYKYGGPSGALLSFVNDIAAAFPDKIISTLAYQYTRRPPRGIKPADNVSICLCSIECDRGQPIEQGCNDFAADLIQWSVLTKHLMIWDYVVQFRSYVSPFPNWKTLQPNLQLFQRLRTGMVFEQGSGGDQSEFSDMRAYLLSKLMWNPDANVDSILNDFATGYYGPAKDQVMQYISALDESLNEKGRHLWIYDVPQNEDFLRYPFRIVDQLNKLEKLPEGATLSNAQQRHLTAAKLPLEFALLENYKVDTTVLLARGGRTREEIILERLDNFVADCQSVGYNHLQETTGYDPDSYRTNYHRFLQRQAEARRSIAQRIDLAEPASNKYAHGIARELINKLTGETDYRYNWLGFEGNDLLATVTLNKDRCSTVRVAFLQDQQSWVFYPRRVVIEVSADGKNYEAVHEDDLTIKPDPKKDIMVVEAHFPERAAKYVRVTAKNIRKCPKWHAGNGQPSWIFADEIEVE